MNIRPEILKNFMVLEGLDGAGTTTQAHLLLERCARVGRAAHLTQEPTKNPIGQCIRSILKGRTPAKPETLAYLFAADRNEHLYGPGGIAEEAQKGRLVICDRYLFSSLAYQSVDCGERLVRRLNKTFPLPEFLVYLDIVPAEGEKRLSSRNEREIFEYQAFQEKAAAVYGKILTGFSASGMKILCIDAGEAPEVIHEKIWQVIEGQK
ncbi:MAG: dTMP kinase [Spirochaetales bacterium]|jgi:dTMP kinase|nr:dTMP kinase [Spirochaetales bacterium]